MEVEAQRIMAPTITSLRGNGEILNDFGSMGGVLEVYRVREGSLNRI